MQIKQFGINQWIQDIHLFLIPASVIVYRCLPKLLFLLSIFNCQVVNLLLLKAVLTVREKVNIINPEYCMTA